MKISVCLFAVLVSACSFAVEVGALPQSEFADTEVSTNFTFAVGAVANRRLVLTLELQASPSNNVEVAIGCDANCDGHLSLDESGLTVGYDSGEWFVHSAEKDAVTSEAVSDVGIFRREYMIRSRHVDPSWNLVKVTRRGVGAADESVAVEQRRGCGWMRRGRRRASLARGVRAGRRLRLR